MYKFANTHAKQTLVCLSAEAAITQYYRLGGR